MAGFDWPIPADGYSEAKALINGRPDAKFDREFTVELAEGDPATLVDPPYNPAACIPGKRPNAGGRPKGREVIRNFSSSASCRRLALARRFWNQIFT